ncbi:RNA binding protein [Striga asiatica]|uniref:RNA binding protein n=1 Tax=Striga asiatica TaxID=4170 RepID=A0A5A7PFC0_STRAF|nr:RNA binding protein [Striga asiatica]
MDKFDRHRGGDRYGNGGEETRHYNSSGRLSRDGGSPFRHHRQDDFRDGGGGRNSPHNNRGGFSGGGGGRESQRAFDSPPQTCLPPLGGVGGVGGGGLRPIGAGIGGFQPMIDGPIGGGGGRGFEPIGGGGREGFRPKAGGVEFPRVGGGSIDGGGFQPMDGPSSYGRGFRPMGGPGGDGGGFRPMGVPGSDGGGFRPMRGNDGGRFDLDEYHGQPTPLTGQKRGYPFSGRERSPVALIKDKRTGLQQGLGGLKEATIGLVWILDVVFCVSKGDVVKECCLLRKRGCCFIKYATSEEADRAIRALHNQYTLPGAMGPIQVRYADGERERLGTTEFKLFVGSLNKQATVKEVEEIFSPYGRVEDVYLMRDEMKQSRGCGFVKFSQRDMAQAAINALNGTYTMSGCDQPLTVRFADPKRPRAGDSRSGSSFGGPAFGPRFSSPAIRYFLRPPLQSQQNMPPPPAQVQTSSSASFSSLQSLQGSYIQPGQMQAPQQLPGQNSQFSVPLTQGQRNAPAAPGQVHVQVNQQLPTTQQLESPSHLAQMLSQQKHNLQATFQSSQQAFNQLQHQVQQLQPANQNTAAHQTPWSGTLPQPVANASVFQPAGNVTATTPAMATNQDIPTVSCNWTEHTSPDGFKYYYNSLTGESKWEKPEELTLYEQQQQQKPPIQHHQVQASQMQVQLQGQYGQLQNQPKPLQQATRTLVTGFSATLDSKNQEHGYGQIPAETGQVTNPTRNQQGVQASQEWMWKNKN